MGLVTVDISCNFGAEILYEGHGCVTITFFQYGKPVFGHRPRYEILLERKHLPEWLLSKARPYRGGLTRKAMPDTWIATVDDTIQELKAHNKEVASICEASS